ncbi:MAG: enoyl-CoA hydratase/isomerase family protein [Proteobacteria bacterium]|nr:enoyl-CoA hydratase/isomerase family protein [Pseudomonadota bacterium]
MAAFQDILYEVDDRVAVLTLNRPDRMNAFGAVLRTEFQEAIRQADADPEVRVLVIKGAGGKAWSAGYDIKETATGQSKGVEEWREILGEEMRFCTAPWECTKPVIAMIEGYCLAGAMEVALCCDIRYCSDDSTFGVVETRFSNGILCMIAPWVVGQFSREMIYTGDRFGADEAREFGVVNRVFAKADLEAETMKIAKRMSRVALDCLRWNKRAINQAYETMGIKSALAYGLEACVIMDASNTPEYAAFNKIRVEQGLGPALAHLSAQFAPYE